MKKIITILAIATLFSCKNTEEYPITHYTSEGSFTFLNDSIVVIHTSIKGIGNYETKIVNLKKQ